MRKIVKACSLRILVNSHFLLLSNRNVSKNVQIGPGGVGN